MCYYAHGITPSKRAGRISASNKYVHYNNIIFIYIPENVKTGTNFIDKVESSTMLRFVRVTYVRPQNEGSADIVSEYCPPDGFSYKTFVPSAIKVGMCSGSPTYESLTMTWERAKVWQSCVGECRSCLCRVSTAVIYGQG